MKGVLLNNYFVTILKLSFVVFLPSEVVATWLVVAIRCAKTVHYATEADIVSR